MKWTITYIWKATRVTLIVPACQLGWEEMENLRGNLRGKNSEWSQPGGSPTTKVTLPPSFRFCHKMIPAKEVPVQKEILKMHYTVLKAKCWVRKVTYKIDVNWKHLRLPKMIFIFIRMSLSRKILKKMALWGYSRGGLVSTSPNFVTDKNFQIFLCLFHHFSGDKDKTSPIIETSTKTTSDKLPWYFHCHFRRKDFIS